ncbi:MAG: TatD family hydrolase [FCB group bacterium]|nr:TatD family hydrolase [FCB group bacterium]
MNLIDTHAHLYDDDFADDLEDVLSRAENAGVNKIICVGVDLTTSERCLVLAEQYDILYAAAGIHPHEASKTDKGYIKELEAFSSHPKVVAIGEIGLDYHYNFSPPPQQIRIFSEQLELSKSLQLPAIVHNRESDRDLLKCLKQTQTRKGVIHCFLGEVEFAQQIFDCGFQVSFTGSVTFKRDLKTNEALFQQSAIEKYMLETDSPYLAPVPHRGHRNEPANVKYVAEQIAAFVGSSAEEIARKTTVTALDLFSKLQQ